MGMKGRSPTRPDPQAGEWDMNKACFVHLHLHSEYSLLDGAIRFSEVLPLAKSLGMEAMALTDHGNLFGAISFYQEARALGIKPIIGCELYVAPKSIHYKAPLQRNSTHEGNYHLVLLAKDIGGYRNLLKLCTIAHLEGFYYKPRIDKDLLSQYSSGLLAMSACLHGEIPTLLLQGQWERAKEVALWYKDLFGEDFFLELMDNGIEEQKKVNQGLIRLGKELGIGVVATNDCHYLRREDAKAHDVLLCIQTGKTLATTSRLKFKTDQFYFKSQEEMLNAFGEIPEALENTLAIAERCSLELELGRYRFPNFPLGNGETPEDRLEALARRGFQERMKEMEAQDPSWYRDKAATYLRRLDYELGVIKEMGFASYFLIVHDFIEHARTSKIPVGPGRGSAAGSLVAYSLRITDVDPIRYNLLFERFLNPERKSMPDIDVDFCKIGRDQVIRYVAQRYGEENVAQITTFGRMEARAVVRDVGRVLGMAYDEVDRLAKLIPAEPGITLEKAMAVEPRLTEMTSQDGQIKELLEIAKSLEGLVRHASTHAAGVVISDSPIVESVPLYRSKEGELVTQYDMKAIELVGLIKFDFLGLRTLTMMEDVLRLLAKRGINLELRNIPLDDRATYELLGSGDTDGVFQVESSGMRDLLVKMKPSVFEDLIALVALYRPGPLGSGMVEEFIERKHGRKPIEYEIPQLEPILKDTYGIILYQEQVMQIAVELAGYTMGQADVLRKAMGKKIASVMQEQRDFFIQGAKKNGIPEDAASRLFDLMAKFGQYGFNKSHSAAYAMLTYQTAYLKAHYPVEFMAALLTSDKEKTDKVIRYLAACRSRSIEVLPPDVNESDYDFSVSEGKIRFGLGGVKNVGRKAIEAILQARSKGKFLSLEDFCRRVDLQKVNRRVIESLIKCGAFDSFGGHRAQYMAALEGLLGEAQRDHRARARGQMSMFPGLGESALSPERLPSVPEWDERERLAYEKESLGFYVTGHPLRSAMGRVGAWCNCDTESLQEMEEKAEVRIVGMRRELRDVTTKRGERMGFLVLEDLKGSVEVICFPEVYRKALPALQEDRPLCVKGSVEASEETRKIIASEIMSVEEVESSLAPPLDAVLWTSQLEEEDLFALKEMILEHPGQRSLRLKMVLESGYVAVLELPDSMKIAPTEVFLTNLEARFRGKVQIEKV
jgi:DNA polymerase-3 subunit alpha